MIVVSALRSQTVSTSVFCTFLLGGAPALAGLLGSTAIFDPYYQETRGSEIFRLDPPLDAVVNRTETEFPCLSASV